MLFAVWLLAVNTGSETIDTSIFPRPRYDGRLCRLGVGEMTAVEEKLDVRSYCTGTTDLAEDREEKSVCACGAAIRCFVGDLWESW